MYRLSDELAKIVMAKIKSPDLETIGNTAFLPKTLNSIGIIDPICCYGSMFPYMIESPKPVLYEDLPFIATGIQAYFLYKKDELKTINEPWEIYRLFVDPTAKDPEEKIDVADAAVLLPTDVEKLTIPVTYHLNTLEQLIAKEPMIVDCLNLEKKHGK
ncbi:MAG: hypothetical protein ACREBR_05290 [bacterium]